MTIRLCVVALVLNPTGHILLVRNRKRNAAAGAPVWELPGGGMNHDEGPLLAASREVFEEARCHIYGARLEDVILGLPKPGAEYRSVIFVVHAAGEGTVLAHDDAIEAAWFRVNHLPQLADLDSAGVIARWAGKPIYVEKSVCADRNGSGSHMNDLIALVAERACDRFGKKGDGLFSAACFSADFCLCAGVKGPLDGHVVRAMLTGRPDIEVMTDGSHYRLRQGAGACLDCNGSGRRRYSYSGGDFEASCRCAGWDALMKDLVDAYICDQRDSLIDTLKAQLKSREDRLDAIDRALGQVSNFTTEARASYVMNELAQALKEVDRLTKLTDDGSLERDALRQTLLEIGSEAASPVPLLLHCPLCSARHIDSGEYATKPHHTHACQSCGHCWRPAVVNTVGVQFLPGFKNSPQGFDCDRIA